MPYRLWTRMELGSRFLHSVPVGMTSAVVCFATTTLRTLTASTHGKPKCGDSKWQLPSLNLRPGKWNESRPPPGLSHWYSLGQ